MVKCFPSFQFDLLRKIMFYQLTLNFVQNLQDLYLHCLPYSTTSPLTTTNSSCWDKMGHIERINWDKIKPGQHNKKV